MEPVPLLDLKLQYAALREELDRAVREVVEAQAFVLGPAVEGFEQAVARYVGAGQAIGCASGTDALVLSLAALGVGAGDEVLTSPFSFFASASCAALLGARPAFVDIDPDSFNLDPERVDAAIGERTRALIPVHLFGQCAAMDRLLQIAADRGIPVIEDAAQALGATYGGASGPAHAGALGTLGCYSFFPSKNLGAFGDGGMVVTSDDELGARVRRLRVHGGQQMYHHPQVGWNSRLDALQAAVLAVKLPHLDRWSALRRANADRYDLWFRESGALDDGNVRLPVRIDGRGHIFNQYTLRVRRRDELREHLGTRGIGHSVYYPVPLHQQECFAALGYGKGDFPHAEQACREVIALPVFPELTRPQQERVVAAVTEFYR